jgi:hypothetical protein
MINHRYLLLATKYLKHQITPLQLVHQINVGSYYEACMFARAKLEDMYESFGILYDEVELFVSVVQPVKEFEIKVDKDG